MRIHLGRMALLDSDRLSLHTHTHPEIWGGKSSSSFSLNMLLIGVMDVACFLSCENVKDESHRVSGALPETQERKHLTSKSYHHYQPGPRINLQPPSPGYWALLTSCSSTHVNIHPFIHLPSHPTISLSTLPSSTIKSFHVK